MLRAWGFVGWAFCHLLVFEHLWNDHKLGIQLPSEKVFNLLKAPQTTSLEGIWIWNDHKLTTKHSFSAFFSSTPTALTSYIPRKWGTPSLCRPSTSLVSRAGAPWRRPSCPSLLGQAEKPRRWIFLTGKLWCFWFDLPKPLKKRLWENLFLVFSKGWPPWLVSKHKDSELSFWKGQNSSPKHTSAAQKWYKHSEMNHSERVFWVGQFVLEKVRYTQKTPRKGPKNNPSL